jgi:hypothetical protein
MLKDIEIFLWLRLDSNPSEVLSKECNLLDLNQSSITSDHWLHPRCISSNVLTRGVPTLILLVILNSDSGESIVNHN